MIGFPRFRLKAASKHIAKESRIEQIAVIAERLNSPRESPHILEIVSWIPSLRILRPSAASGP